MKSRHMNKAISLLLALILMIPVSALSAILTVGAAPEETVTVSEAELVAGNYDGLTEGEKNFLKSNFVASSSLTFPAPSESTLIDVDPEAKTIAAAPYVQDGYTWQPAAARVVWTTGSEDVELDAAGNGAFAYDGASYTVEADYVLEVAVDEAVQLKLLNGGYYLAKGIENTENVADYDANFYTVSGNIDYFVSLTDGSLAGGAKLSSADTIAAILRVKAEADANDGFFDIANLADEYADAASKTAFLFEKGSDFRAAAVRTYNDIKTIREDAEVETIMRTVIGKTTARGRKITLALNAIDALLAGTKGSVEDEWKVLSGASVLKAGLTDGDYVALDALVEDMAGAEYHADGAKTALKLSPVTVSQSVAQYDVTVVLKASYVAPGTVDSAALTALDDHSATIRVAAGTTSSDVEAAVAANGIEALALAAWGIVDGANFTRTASALPEQINADTEYVIEYAPKTVALSYDFETELPASVPYGYNLTLPANSDAALVYDYTIEDAQFLQGDVYTVDHDVQIKRSAGKPWDVVKLGKLVADVYASDLTPEQQAILDSAALKTENVLLREPTNEDGLVAVSSVGGSYRVDAETYRTGIEGVDWIPVSGVAIKDGAAVASFTFTGSVATFDAAAFDQVEVVYKTVLTNIPEEVVLETLNLPDILADEVEAQIADLELLNTIYSKLGKLDQPTLNQIKIGVNGSDMGQAAKDAVKAIVNACVDKSVASLYLYEYITSFNEEGIAFYYRDNNSLKMRTQAAILRENLGTVLADPEFVPLLEDIEKEDYLEKIQSIYDVLSAVTLASPNAAVDTTSTSVASLAEAIAASVGHTNRFTSPSGELALTKKLTAAAPDRMSVNVKVVLRDSRGTELASKSGAVTFPAGETVTAATIEAVNAKIDELAAEIGVDTEHYGAARELGLSEGTTIPAEDVSALAVFSPNAYTCVVRDENDADVDNLTFYYDDMFITLPASAEEGVVYKYTFDGVSYTVGDEAKNVPITASQFADGSYGIIRREILDTEREYLLSLVEEINQGIADAGMLDGNNLAFALIPMEDASENWTIVFRMSPKSVSAAKSAVTNAMEALTKSSYTYITLGGQLIREDSEISVQALIDAFLNSDADLETIKAAINPDGTLNEMAPIAGATVIGETTSDGKKVIKVGTKQINDTDILGAKLLEFDMTFGQNETDPGKNVKLYVTLEDFGKSADDLKKIYKVANKASEYGTIAATGGRIEANLTLPERAFQAYLAAVELYDNTELGKLENAKDVDRALEIAKQFIEFLTDDETIDLGTFENTAEKLGKTVDLSSYDRFYSKGLKAARNIINNSTISLNSDTAGVYDADIHYDIEALFEHFEVKETLKNLVKERSTGLDANVFVNITNTVDDYEALIIDSKASGFGKILYSKDLATDIAKIHDKTIVILLKDIAGDLVIPADANLDLHGYTVNGSVTANAALRILDSSYATDSGAGVTGTVTGNVTISGGTYASDVSAMLKAGFEQKDGLVRNEHYFIIDNGNGEIEVHVDKKSEAATGEVAKAAAIELAMDEAFHTYAGAAMHIGDFNVYSFTLDDVTSLKNISTETKAAIRAGLNKADIDSLASDILAAITPYTDESHEMVPGEVLATYGVGYNPWSFSFSHETAGDYITAKIAPDLDRHVDVGTITVQAHDYVEVSRDDATCTEDGTIYYECSECGATYEETIDALDHDYQEFERVESTCVTAGHITYKCTRCDDSFDEPLPLGPHTPAADWEIVRPATEDEPGLKVIRCTVCGEILEEEEIPYGGPIDLQLIPSFRLSSYAIDNEARTITLVAKPGQPTAVFQLKLPGYGNDIFTWTDDAFADGCQIKIKDVKYSADTDAQGIRYFIIPSDGGVPRTEKVLVKVNGTIYEYTVNVTFAKDPVHREGVEPGYNADKYQTGFEPGRDDLIYVVSKPGYKSATMRVLIPKGASIRVISEQKPHLFQTPDKGKTYREVQNDEIDDKWFVYFKSLKADGINEYDLEVTLKDGTKTQYHVIVEWQ